jgi:AcrR family transcriptional regulator
MLDAARELLNENGPAAVTHLRVAEASGVARATVYRHWPDRAGILVDLLRRGADLHLALPPTDLSIVERVAGLLRMFAAALNGDGGQILAAMIGLAGWDEDVFAALERMTAFGPKMLRDLLTTGVDEGSLAAGTDIDLLMDLLIGPLYLRRLLLHDEITDEYIDRLIADTLSRHLVT